MQVDAGRPDDLTRVIIAAALGFAAATLYVLTAARDIVLGDSGELVAAAATLGVVHPPGYPLLTLLGHAFARLPIEPLAFRVNLLSAVASAATVGLTFLIAHRLSRNRWAAAVAALLLAAHPLFWEWSLVVEAFPLNNLLAAAVIYSLLCWDSRPARVRWLALAALAGALGAANHHTIVFLIPSAAVVLWRHRAVLARRPAMLAGCAAAALAPLSLYLYIPWAASRGPFVNWGDVSSARELLDHFLRTAYGTVQLTTLGNPPASSPFDRLAVFLQSFTPLEAVLVVVGAFGAWNLARGPFWVIALAFALAGPGFAAYANIDVHVPAYRWVLSRFFLLPHVIVAPLAAFGFAVMAAGLGRVLGPRRHTIGQAVALVAAAACLAAMIAAQYPRLDQKNNHLARTFAEDVLDSMDAGSVLLASGDEVALPLTYLQALEGRRREVTVVILPLLAQGEWYGRQLRTRDRTLVVPFGRLDGRNPSASLRAFVEANPTRRFSLVGPPSDMSLERDYWYWPRGLVLQIESKSRDVTLDAMAAENERLLRRYRIPGPEIGRRQNFDPHVLRHYATPAQLVGLQYMTARMHAEARTWFQRALEIDPGYTEAEAALSKLALR